MNFHHCEDVICESQQSHSSVTENSSFTVCDAVVGEA